MPAHTVLAVVHARPAPTHWLLPGSQQPGATHAVSGAGQQDVPGEPHALQELPEQIVSAPEHALPVATHLVASQHPAGHAPPAQQSPPVLPQAWHEPPAQTLSVPEQAASFATHRSDVASQQPPAVHGLDPLQQDSPGPPHAQEPLMHR
jgi:hypothetical protein